jgi:hypothetical protein
MINLIEGALRSKIEALNFVGRYGGLVRPIKHQKNTYPVSTYVSASQCQENGLYKALVPDDSYASVSYFELLRQSPGNITGPKKNLLTNNFALRFVCWLNYQKLGLSEDTTADQFAAQAMKALKDAQTFEASTVKGQIIIDNMAPILNDSQQVFGTWSYYAKNEHIFFYPYGFFAIDMSLTARINLNCTNDVSDPVELDCIWQTT